MEKYELLFCFEVQFLLNQEIEKTVDIEKAQQIIKETSKAELDAMKLRLFETFLAQCK